MSNLDSSERKNNILEFEIDADSLITSSNEELPTNETLVNFVASQYVSKSNFFDFF